MRNSVHALYFILSFFAYKGYGSETAPVFSAANEESIKDRYIVVFKTMSKSKLREKTLEMHTAYAKNPTSGTKILETYYYALPAMTVSVTNKEDIEKLRKDPDVNYIEEDRNVYLFEREVATSWGLDRIDQESLPLDGVIDLKATGKGSHAYIIDTGINITHSDFKDRIGDSTTVVNDNLGLTDCKGHGTHVAGTVAGSTFGVARKATIHAIKVFSCNSTLSQISSIVRGIDWIIEHHKNPAVINMSLGAPGASPSMETAVRNATEAGITVVVAAGNSNVDACTFSPAREPSAITVGASGQSDKRTSFSNYGKCVSLYAPGSNIVSASNTVNSASVVKSGTSMASPHVAGAVAYMLSGSISLNPSQIKSIIMDGASKNQIRNARQEDNNLILNINTLSLGMKQNHNMDLGKGNLGSPK